MSALALVLQSPSHTAWIDDNVTENDSVVEETSHSHSSKNAPPETSSGHSNASDDVSMNAAIDQILDGQQSEDEQYSDSPDTRTSPFLFGGISNLGNTCYMASSIQMLASLDGLTEALQRQPSRDDPTKFRELLLQVLQELTEGRTVQPQDLKQALDERSPLFVGYSQEDAHEFIATLIDLLDEDYQILEDENESDSDDVMHTNTDSGKSTAPFLEEESSPKKQRIEYGPEQQQELQITSTGSSRSFCDLNVEEIGLLLYSSPATPDLGLVYTKPPTLTMESPICKLRGGRINTGDIKISQVNGIDSNLVPLRSTDSNRDDNASTPLPTPDEHTTPLKTYFQTEIRVRLTCDSCKYSRCHKEKFFHLSLEISPHEASVEDGLRKFFRPEKRELKCEKCFFGSATQTTEITKLPRALLLHFKRFIVDGDAFFSMTYRKNQASVTFDDRIGSNMDGLLSDYLAIDCELPDGAPSGSYGIRSVINHMGSSATFGHYTTDSFRLHPSGERRWVRFDDAFVSAIASEDALIENRETAYLVMYELDGSD